jgi:hypothetical protein
VIVYSWAGSPMHTSASVGPNGSRQQAHAVAVASSSEGATLHLTRRRTLAPGSRRSAVHPSTRMVRAPHCSPHHRCAMIPSHGRARVRRATERSSTPWRRRCLRGDSLSIEYRVCDCRARRDSRCRAYAQLDHRREIVETLIQMRSPQRVETAKSRLAILYDDD